MHILDRVEGAFDEIIALRRRLHSFPELSGEEIETEKTICAYLDKLGVSYVSGVAGHGVVATIGTKKEPAVGIRGDIDALPIEEKTGLPYASKNPGVMHACGHDFHTASLLGLARIFQEVESELPGTVKLFFQPAEETTGGAKDMIAAGCMENPSVSHVLGWHVEPRLNWDQIEVPLGRMNAATCELVVNVKGKACHGAHPERGVDAILVASHIVVALQSISARFFAPTTPVVVTVGVFEGGTKNNIITGDVHLHGTLRALENGVMARLKELVRRTIEQTALAYGATAEVALNDGYPALVNDRETALVVADTGRELFGMDQVSYMDEPSLGADDFAYFANAAPSCYFNVGVHREDQEMQALHSEVFAPDERALKRAVALLAQAALQLMKQEA